MRGNTIVEAKRAKNAMNDNARLFFGGFATAESTSIDGVNAMMVEYPHIRLVNDSRTMLEDTIEA